MDHWIINIALVLFAFFGMEAVAWFTHKYIMHGIFWYFHKDHHVKDHEGFFEKNDFFFLLFATPGIICLALGSFYAVPYVFYIGLGITLYGFTYFLVHDIFIHQRFKMFRKSDHWYFKALRRAHKMHHKHTGKEDGECFGMLWVPFKYYWESRKQKNQEQANTTNS